MTWGSRQPWAAPPLLLRSISPRRAGGEFLASSAADGKSGLTSRVGEGFAHVCVRQVVE
jgi:hypothetical protein